MLGLECRGGVVFSVGDGEYLLIWLFDGDDDDEVVLLFDFWRFIFVVCMVVD